MHLLHYAYLPCEWSWVFEWLFKHDIPLLLGDSFTSRCCLIASDGDPCIYETLLDVRGEGLWKNTDHQLCAFHLINQQYADKVSSRNISVKHHWDTAKKWIYSWVNYCETRDEYIKSRNLFQQWLHNLCMQAGNNKHMEIFCRDMLEFVTKWESLG